MFPELEECKPTHRVRSDTRPGRLVFGLRIKHYDSTSDAELRYSPTHSITPSSGKQALGLLQRTHVDRLESTVTWKGTEKLEPHGIIKQGTPSHHGKTRQKHKIVSKRSPWAWLVSVLNSLPCRRRREEHFEGSTVHIHIEKAGKIPFHKWKHKLKAFVKHSTWEKGKNPSKNDDKVLVSFASSTWICKVGS